LADRRVERYFIGVCGLCAGADDDNIAYWLKKWSNLQEITKYTGEDLKKIPGINEKMIKNLLVLHEVYKIVSGKKKEGKVSKIIEPMSFGRNYAQVHNDYLLRWYLLRGRPVSIFVFIISLSIYSNVPGINCSFKFTCKNIF
jgi:hypothetical protein